MKILKLSSEHAEAIRPLFEEKKWMGADRENEFFVNREVFQDVGDTYYNSFTNTYLTDLRTYHAYGSFDELGNVRALIAFHESNENAEWYWTHIRSNGGKDFVQPLLDAVIDHNEKNGRYKFYSMWNLKYRRIYRKFAFSKYNSERYDSFDEYVVPAKTRCIYTMPWMVLYNRTLVPVDTVVRCTYLKREYRNDLGIAGNL